MKKCASILFTASLIALWVSPGVFAEPPAHISVIHTAKTLAELPALKNDFRVHLIDVGTGLSVLIEGPDFNLLFDAGSADDKRGNTKLGSKSRVVAYLTARLGNNGQQQCSVFGDPKALQHNRNAQIDYLFASHPHEDHISHMLPVLECFTVNEFWEPGVHHPTKGYQALRDKVLGEPTILYKTATPSFCLKDTTRCTAQFAVGDIIKLGTLTSAKATVLHVGTQKAHDPNSYSIVLRVDLGSTSLLLTGDAESGPRAPTSSTVGHIEKYLIERYEAEIDVDILQVGHHGSLTSSRDEFITAVSPKLALISAGPKKYGSVILPDPEVLQAFSRFGIQTINTDLHDKIGCPVADKIGTNERTSPGGCDNYVLHIKNSQWQTSDSQ